MEREPDPLRELRRQLRLDADPEPVVAATLTTVRWSRAAEDDRRRLLWRDSATILIGVVLALIAGQLLIPAQTAGPTGSPTPEPSLVAIGSLGPPQSIPPGATFGPILNPSLGVDATPTPIPVITIGPTPSPTPSPSPPVAPTSSPRPSVKPTPKPPKPTPSASPRATPSPIPPPPDAQFSPEINLLTVTFRNGSTGDTAWHWDFGDGIGSSTQREPTYTYLAPGTYPVTLTVSGPGGPDSSITHNVTVPPG